MFRIEKFRPRRVLAVDAAAKRLVLAGAVGDDAAAPEDTVVVIKRRGFAADTLEQAARLVDAIARAGPMQPTLINDIYGFYIARVPDEGELEVEVVWPARPRDIAKHARPPRRLVRETPELYARVVLPWIEEVGTPAWVDNILEGRAEGDRIVRDDPDARTGFVLLPDSKWADPTNLLELYCLALVRARGLRTLRDLRREHLPLLRNVLAAGRRAVAARYGLGEASQRLFVHYHPTYFHLHVHFTHVDAVLPSALAERAHLLEDVIEQLERVGDDALAARTFTLSLAEDEPLVPLLMQEP